jgi:hypothetical protein
MKNIKTVIIILAAIIIAETIFLSFVLGATSKETIGKTGPSFAKGLDNIYVQVRIKQETKDGTFSDSLYYSADEWAKATADQVKEAVQKRVDNWEKVTHPGK